MLYLTQTDTRLTCVASQRSFMSIVWYTAKAMNGKPKGSKVYLKPATAFVQKWLQKNSFSGMYIFLHPQQATSSIEVNQTAQHTVDNQSGFMACIATLNLLTKLVTVLNTLTSLGFFSYPKIRRRQFYNILKRIELN